MTRENLNVMQDLVGMTGHGEPNIVEEEDIRMRIGGEKTLEEDLSIDLTLIDIADVRCMVLLDVSSYFFLSIEYTEPSQRSIKMVAKYSAT